MAGHPASCTLHKCREECSWLRHNIASYFSLSNLSRLNGSIFKIENENSYTETNEQTLELEEEEKTKLKEAQSAAMK